MSRFVGRTWTKDTALDGGIVCDNSDASATNGSKSRDDAVRMTCSDFRKTADVKYGTDNFMDVISGI